MMYRFTIRDLLWLIVVVAVGCAWWIHVRAIEYRHEQQIEEFNSKIISTVNESKAKFDRIMAKYKEGTSDSFQP